MHASTLGSSEAEAGVSCTSRSLHAAQAAHVELVGAADAGLARVPRLADGRVIVIGRDARPVHPGVYATACIRRHTAVVGMRYDTDDTRAGIPKQDAGKSG